MKTLGQTNRQQHTEQHITPMSSAHVVMEVCGAALMSVLPAVSGLALFTYANSLMEFARYGDLPSFSLSNFGMFTLRLPAYCLFCGCIALAVRNLPIARLTPWLISVAAGLAVLWRYDPALHPVSSIQPFIPLHVMQTGLAVAIAFGVLLLILSSLYYSCRLRLHGMLVGLLLVVMLAGPAGLGLSTVVGNVGSEISHRRLSAIGDWEQFLAAEQRNAAYRLGLGKALKPIYLSLGQMYPTVFMGSWRHDVFHRYERDEGSPEPRRIAMLTMMLSFIALPLWFFTCTACLAAVRHAQFRRE